PRRSVSSALARHRQSIVFLLLDAHRSIQTVPCGSWAKTPSLRLCLARSPLSRLCEYIYTFSWAKIQRHSVASVAAVSSTGSTFLSYKATTHLSVFALSAVWLGAPVPCASTRPV